ncbi:MULTISPECIES: hypothetical protein [Maribellus]|uniref:Uncharacterized protein n=1 Tax=Maribellus comscasis TaxID=2681766 RepID=A0A6I6JTQ4_9BACT|nr:MULTISPECIES: hypothetical protein [Maribellus]MCG6187376.1 hypothetical protein [Maribellus maritimus]QGY43527.1 hypothetical protein GM418_07590 [Maribellus comscasis]
MKEKVITKLNRYKINYKESGKSVVINLGLNQEIIILFLDNEKIKITDKLRGWNLLSGMLEVSLKKVMILQFIFVVITCALLFIILYYTGFDFNTMLNIITLVAIFNWGYVIYWTNYYHVKAENFKSMVMNWIENDLIK